MIIHFSPQRRDDTLSLECAGDVLTINGVAYDFTPLPDGASLPREAIDGHYFAGDVERIDGQLHIRLILPHGANAPRAALDPVPLVAVDGVIDVPGQEGVPNAD